MLLNKSLEVKETDLVTDCDFMLAVQILDLGCKDTMILSVYISPIDSPYYRDKNSLCNNAVLGDVILNCQENHELSINYLW